MAASFSISPRPGARPRSLGEVQKALPQLLREPVSIRDLSTVLEAVLDVSAASKHPVLWSKPPARGAGSQRSFVRRILDGLRQFAREQVAQALALLDPGALSPAPFAGTLSPQNCGAFSAGNSSHGPGAVAGYGALSLG